MKSFSYIFFLLFHTYCFAQGFWTQKANFPGIARIDATYLSIGLKGYVGAGSDVNTNFQNDFWEYDVVNNLWTQKSNFSGAARWQAVSFTIGTKGYVGTGGNTMYNNDFWEYDPASDSWTQKASLPADGRTAAAAFSIGNKGYIGTGWGGNPVVTNHNDFWEYDPATNLWSQKANVPGYKRSFAVGLSIGNKGYIGTGNDSLGRRDDFWEYDPATDAWIQKANFAGGLRADIDGGYFIVGNHGYIGTGVNGSGLYNDFWKYNPSNDTWTAIPNFPASVRIGTIGFSINNKGYIGLGWYSTPVCFNDLWEYTPDSTEGVNEVANSATIFNAYPNPTSGAVTLQYELPKGEKEGEIILYNTQGAEVKRYKVDNTFKDLLLDNTMLPAGVYFYQLQTSKGSVGSKKMVVIK